MRAMNKSSEHIIGTLEYFINVGEVEGPAFAKRKLRGQFHKMDPAKFKKLWAKVNGYIKIEKVTPLPKNERAEVGVHEQLLKELELDNW